MSNDSMSVAAVSYAAVFESVLSPHALLTTDLRIIAVNRALCAVTGGSKDDLVGTLSVTTRSTISPTSQRLVASGCRLVEIPSPMFSSRETRGSSPIAKRCSASTRTSVKTSAESPTGGRAALPLISNDAVIGVLGFIYAERMAFNRPQRLACSTIANLASQATSRAQLIAEQSVALNSIDKALLEPHLDTVPGLQIDGLYRPSTQITSAGGDWYDVIALTPERVLIVIGDVANHGAASVGEMARARATVHALATEEHPPHVIATRASNALRRLATTITTAVIAIYETESRMLTWTTAGHPYPLLLAANGQSQYLEETHGPPLGVLTGGSYRSNQRVLEPGDTLVVFTDGLVERRGESIDNGLDLLRSAASSALKHETAFTLRVYGMLAPTRMHVDDIAILAVTIID